MASASFTPGPWKIGTQEWPKGHVRLETFATFNSPNRRWETHIYSNSGQTARSIGATQEEAEANAHLIAAAPDLLEAAEEGANPCGADFLDWLADRLVHVYGENPNVDFVQALRRKAHKTRVALAKAEGREP